MSAQSNLIEGRKRRFQFSLATLMGGTAAVSLLSAMWAWRGERGTLEFFMGAALCVTAVGVFRRRIILIVVGLLLLAGMRFALDYSIRNTTISYVSGRAIAVLNVNVVDTITGEPIPRARVRLLRGNAEEDLQRTGTEGAAELSYDAEFTLTQSHNFLFSRDRRVTNTRGMTLEIVADGYETLANRLSQHLGPQCEMDGVRLPPITIGLKRKFD